MAGCWYKIAAGFFCAAVAVGYATAAEGAAPAASLPEAAVDAGSYPMRRRADMALALGDFAGAEKDYRVYISAAQARGDGNAMLDGAVRLVNLRLQQGDAAGAEAEWRQFVGGSGGVDTLTGQLLEADIMMVRGDFAAAAEKLSGLLANADLPESLHSPVAYALGEALMRQGKYIDAVGVYRLLAASGKEPEARFREIFALQSADELIDSQKKISELAADDKLTASDSARLELLKIRQAVGEKRFSEAAAQFSKLPEATGPDRLRYDLALALGRYSDSAGKPEDALNFRRGAFAAAPGMAERKYALLLLIDGCSASGLVDEAAAAMERYLAYFPEDAARFDNKLQLAHLLNRSERYSGAAAIYRNLTADAAAPLTVRLAAAREGSAVCARLGDDAGAEAMLEFVIANGPDAVSRADGNLLMAQYLYKKGDYERCLKFATDAARDNTACRFPALHVLMLAQQELRDYKSALGTAAILKNQGVDEWRPKGAFAEAKLLETSGDIQNAINAYAAFANLWSFSDSAPDALYAAGNLAFNSADCARASELFQLLADRYPRNPYATHALYLAVYAEYLQSHSAEMNKLIARLRHDYPDSEYTIGALLWQVDLLKLNQDYKAAAALLDEMAEKYEKLPAKVVEQIRFERAALFSLLGDDEAAAPLFSQVAASDAPIQLRAKSNFALGDINMKFGDYPEAERCFKLAGEQAPDGEFAVAALGRVADSYYNSGMLEHDKAKLEGAAVYYQQVLERSPKSGLVYCQSICKLASSLAERGESDAAVNLCRELLTEAAAWPAVTADEAVWLREAVRLLVGIQLADGTAAGVEAAGKTVDAAGKLNLPPPNDFEEQKSLIRAAGKLAAPAVDNAKNAGEPVEKE